MLKSWHIENFKAIVNSGDLKLAPVTVFAGLNSSGKSSLLQSILMISQTLSNRLPDRALIPNGPIVQLGTFQDILNQKSNSRILSVSFEIIRIGYSIKVCAKFNTEGGKFSSAIEASKVEVESVSLEIDFMSPNPLTNEGAVNLGLPQLEVHSSTGMHFNLVINKLLPSKLKEFLQDVMANYLKIIPYSGSQSNYLGILELNKEVLGSYLVDFSHFLPDDLVYKSQSEDGIILNSISYYDIDESVSQVIRFFTSQIKYLGPLRDDTGNVQRFPRSSEIDDVGEKGQYAAAVYDANQNARIDYYNPYTKLVERVTLKEALNSWIRYLQVAREIKTKEAGQNGFDWQVVHKEDLSPLPLTAVGFGISQILPILVMGLLSKHDTLLIVEQPELHLHPKVQARLGDFFMGLAKCGKQCLIETHSENLINQLRLHIVEAGGQDKSDCLIYFVEQDEQGAAKFEPVKISPRGNILNWPDGFFDETMLQEDKIAAASIKARADAVENGKYSG